MGKLNLYALFAELAKSAINQNGFVGFLIPTGIATDDSTKAFFAEITGTNRLVSLFDFENREALFKGVHRSSKFCLLTLGHTGDAAQLAFFATRPDDLKDPRRSFTLTTDEFSLINPNTRTCPVFRSRQDAELTRKIYRAAPVLIKEAEQNTPEVNPWNIRFSQGLFNMTSASHLFQTYEELQMQEGVLLQDNQFKGNEKIYLPLYEAKMVHHYDHRWATYETDGTTSRDCTLEEKQNPDYHNLPRYWVDSWQVTLRTARAPKNVLDSARHNDTDALREALTLWTAGMALQEDDDQQATELLAEPATLFKQNLSPRARDAMTMAEEFPLTRQEYRQLSQWFRQQSDPWPLTRELLENRRPKYLLGWRDICRSTDERTVIAGIIPLVAVGHTFPLIFFQEQPKLFVALLANLNSIILDFIARQKVGGTHLTYGYFKQFPVLQPSAYTPNDLQFILPRVLELTYTSHDLKPFARDLGYDGEPFPFDPARRHQLKCELDACYARLYNLTRDELRYILDPADVMGKDYPSETFRVLKKKEIQQLGEYRTRRLVLEAWDRLERGELQ